MHKSLSLLDGPTITLDEMLQARDLRAQNQRLWLNKYRAPLISLTLVIPGAIKRSSGTEYLFNTAVEAIETLCHTKHFTIINQQDFSTHCGYEALFAVNAEAEQLKTQCINLETNHPFGRLWDIDILCPIKGIISRQDKTLTARRCLICQEDAHACARSHKHSLPELIHVIEEIINVAIHG